MPRLKTKKNATPRARSQEAKQELREKILREAIGLYSDVGYQGFTMRRLASRIGYTAAAVYVYYKDKDELLIEVINNGYEQFRAAFSPRGANALERLQSIGLAYLDFAFGNPELYKLMFMHRPNFLFDLSPERVAQRTEVLRMVDAELRRVMSGAGLQGSASQDVAEIFWALIHGLVSLALTVPLFDESWARAKFAVLVTSLAPIFQSSE